LYNIKSLFCFKRYNMTITNTLKIAALNGVIGGVTGLVTGLAATHFGISWDAQGMKVLANELRMPGFYQPHISDLQNIQYMLLMGTIGVAGGTIGAAAGIVYGITTEQLIPLTAAVITSATLTLSARAFRPA
jgi:hypothetical protein